MLQATEQQLSLVSRKVQRLEASVQTQMDHLKTLRQQRNEAVAHAESLRAQLAAAEEASDRLCKEHDEAQSALKHTAEEYAGAQLLQKKYQNAVQVLQGQCRSYVRLLNAERGGQSLVIADECTINAVERKKSFVVDSVFDDSALDDEQLESAMQVSNMVADLLGGINSTMITYGPHNSGKTSFLFGSQAAALLEHRSSGSRNPQPLIQQVGVFERFVFHLFDNLEANEVTHFNIRCSFAELNQEQLVDLLSEYGGVAAVLGYRGGVVGGGHQQNLSDLCSVQVQSAADVTQLLHSGLLRMAQSRSRSPAGAYHKLASHTFFSLLVENFNVKGHFRRATATFVDLCGLNQGGAALNPEQVWVNKSLTALSDVISMLSAANQQQIQATGQPLTVQIADIPHRHHRLIQLLKEAIGGNSKTLLLCCVDCKINSLEEMLSALSYAYYFKTIKNFPVPYDIPPELQRLNLQMNRFQED